MTRGARASGPIGRKGAEVPGRNHGRIPDARPGSAATSLGSRLLIPAVLLACAACQPTVKVEAPEKPIVINLNVKIEQEVRVKIERDVEELLKSQPELF